jgi:hypothetical protein
MALRFQPQKVDGIYERVNEKGSRKIQFSVPVWL